MTERDDAPATSATPHWRLQDDYSEGCPQDILDALASSRLESLPSYGTDHHCAEARDAIRTLIGNPQAAVHFVAGGTLANLIVVATLLRPHEAVISVESGHVLGHEAGAIEATGHKVVAVPGEQGKLTPAGVLAALRAHAAAPHVVKPALVYLSNATELGTVYRRDELAALSRCCREHGLLLYVDGARMATALRSPVGDLTPADLAAFTDVFLLGGTKNGALLGEAIVINDPARDADFAYGVKQRGAMLAKGRVMGLQFAALLAERDIGDGGERERLYFRLADRANAQAARLSRAIAAKGFALWMPTESNQVFPILPRALIARLSTRFAFHVWQDYDEHHAVVRFVASWATPDAAIDALIAAL